ncbi:hypothetical protein FA13DRAFT_1733326 [Coprinellus micaceus]|uniref:Uncharacterized protein n=1 Tax=Coprinellus micaceus TaxID=71717 RepID=A0A4Y7TBF4_COPMI|nr:hypothetical protein FA13DRAFT_1733326 [Coprinellus micaceus]
MRPSTFIAAILALGSLASALPTPAQDYEELDARAGCVFSNIPRFAQQRLFCDAQGCRGGGGGCAYNAQTKRCTMVNMRGSGAPFGCQYCGCSAV